MFHEYALDPEALRSWANFKYLIDQFGLDKGRLISKFPSKWKKSVYEACAGMPDGEKKNIEVALKNIDESLLFASGREFNKDLDWISNASQSHALSEFQAIITILERADVFGGLDHEKIREKPTCWKSGIPPVRRKACDMAAAAEKLLKASSDIIFVDQHYNCKPRHNRPLAAFLRNACTGSTVKRLEYHMKFNGATANWFNMELEKQVRYLGLPESHELTFYRWSELPGRDEFHGRYILTELAGVRFDVGLDESDDPDGGQTTDVAAMDDETYRHRWMQHQPHSGIFEFVDAWKITSGSVERLTEIPKLTK